MFLFSALFVISCSGGGGGGGSSSLSGGTVAGVFFTDDPADEFPVMDITVYEVNLCSDHNCVNKVNLYDNSTGLIVDLAKLNGILQYIDTVTIPEGTYNRLEIILGGSAGITDNQGQAHEAFFMAMDEKPNKPNIVQCPSDLGGNCYIRFNGAVESFSSGQLVIDFVLKDFEVATHSCSSEGDTSSWCIEEVKMHPVTPSDDSEFELFGMLAAQGADSITVTYMGTDYTINLTDDTICEINGINHMGADACLSNLVADSCLEIKILEDPSSATMLTATKIEAESASRCGLMDDDDGEMPSFTELKGTVDFRDITTFTLNTHTDPITVTDNTMCQYNAGTDMDKMGMMNMGMGMEIGASCLENLQVGWLVEVKLNNNNEAVKIELED